MLKKIKNFILAVFKQKKTIIFVFLFLIICGLILPKPALAKEEWGSLLDWTLLVFGLNNYLMMKVLGIAAKPIFNAFVAAIASVIVIITGVLAVLAAMLLNWVTSEGFIAVSFTGPDNVMVTQGWTVIRDLTNMLIVLGFIIIGIATILKFKEYEARKTLVPLILVALLVNFSLLICGIIIDASHIIMDHFLKSGGSLVKYFSKQIITQSKTLWANVLTGSPLEMLAIAMGSISFNFAAFIVFFLFACLFTGRYIMLWILVILSPLAFFCRVFNFTQRYWTMWWNQFFQWSIIGIPAAFFFWLADIAYTYKLAEPPKVPGFGLFLEYYFPAFILGAGFFVSLKLSPIGAAVLTTAATFVTGGVGRMAKGAGKAVGQRLKESRLGSGVRRAYGRTLEAIPVIGRRPGETAQRLAAERKKIQERYESLLQTDPARFKAILKSRGRFRSPQEKGAIGAVAANAGILDFSDPLQQEKYRLATDYNYNVKEAEKRDPRLRIFDRKKIKEWQAKINPATGRYYTESEAKEAEVKKGVQGLSPAEIRKLIPDALKTPIVVTNLTPEQVKGLRRASPEQIAAIKKNATTLNRKAIAAGRRGDYKEMHRLIKLRNEIKSL